MIYTRRSTAIFKRLAVGVIAALLIFILLGCHASDSGEPAATQTPIPQYTLPPVVKSPEPTFGGELTFAIPNKEGTTYNPLKVKNFALYNFFSLIYEKPLRIGNDGTAQPELVETWSVDETGTVWTFTWRKGVKWQRDMGEVTTADLLYTISLLRTYTAAESSYAKYSSMIVDCTAVDSYTFILSMSEPGNAALYFMTFPVLCQSYCQAGNIDTDVPLGTGPYFVSAFNMPGGMTLEPNASWWKQQPYIRKLNVVGLPDHDAEMSSFDQNLLDIVTTSELTVDTYQKFEEVDYVDYQTQYYDCLVPNMAGLFGDVNLRQALAYALDKRDIIAKALLGHAVAVDYPVPPDSFLSGGSANIYEYNRQKALEALELSGWKDRDNNGIVEQINGDQIIELKFQILVPNDTDEPYRLDVADNITAQLKACGMDATVTLLDREVYKQALDTGAFQLALCSFYLDVNPDITPLVGTGGHLNYGNFSDADMDALLEACKAATDAGPLKAGYLALEERFLATMPQIGLYFRTNSLLYKADINIASGMRDRNLFSTIPSWYLYTTADTP
jgi:ABC-type transport system substrate-binding protein